MPTEPPPKSDMASDSPSLDMLFPSISEKFDLVAHAEDGVGVCFVLLVAGAGEGLSPNQPRIPGEWSFGCASCLLLSAFDLSLVAFAFASPAAFSAAACAIRKHFVCIYVYRYICINISIYLYTYISMYAIYPRRCIYVYRYICINISIYLHTYISMYAIYPRRKREPSL
jgi:hypothetical protein